MNNTSINLHCYSCGKLLENNEENKKISKQQYPVCNQKSDQISLEKHFLCNVCHLAFENVKLSVIKYQLKWFNKDFQLEKVLDSNFIKMVQFDSNFTKQTKRKSQIFISGHVEKTQNNLSSSIDKKQYFQLNLPNDIYSAIINDNIQSDDLHHVYWLPKTVQYLIYLTSVERMRPEERRQRVKKTLQAICYLYSVDEMDLKYLAIIVQTLFCYMDEEAILKILDRLLRGLLQNNVSMEFFLIEQVYEIEKSFEQRHIHKKPIQFRPDNIIQILFSTFILFDFFKDEKLTRHISQIVHLSHENLTMKVGNSSESHKKFEQVLELYLKKNISDSSAKLQKLSPTAWDQLVEIKKQKNHLNLIMKIVKKEQQENQQIIKQMQNKFKKQKDQYINKIVKLNNQIEQLENQLKQMKENSNQLTHSTKSNRTIRIKNQDEDVKSNPEMKIIHTKTTKNQPITQRTQIPQNQGEILKKNRSEAELLKEVQQSQSQETLTYLKSILQVTDIISFNSKFNKKNKKQAASFPLPELPDTIKQLSQLIITQIDTLQKKVSFLFHENKKLNDQSLRLLSILKRKEQSWLPLLQEKDEIISLYEKALILLERGYILAQQPLSSRIQGILKSVSNVHFIRLQAENDDISVRESTSVRGSIYDDYIEQFIGQKQSISLNTTPAKDKSDNQKKSRNSTTQKGSDNIIKKKTKQSTRSKQCFIF